MDNPVFFAISYPQETKVHWLRSSLAGNYQFRFCDFASRRPLLIPMEEQPAWTDFNPYYRASEKHQELSQQGYQEKVEKARQAILDKELQKVVLSRVEERQRPEDPVATFERMVQIYPAAAVYLFSHPQAGTWLGASPEKLLSWHDDLIETVALAGTLPAHSGESFGPKEEEEQQLVTDYLFEKLSGEEYVSEIKLRDRIIDRAGDLLHLKTEISAKLNGGWSLKHLLKTLHPTPAVLGLPPGKAGAIIKDLEQYDRQYYTGYFGLDSPARGDFFVNLRCMQWTEDKALLYAGGGVVADSDPIKEWEETAAKLQTMAKLLQE